MNSSPPPLSGASKPEIVADTRKAPNVFERYERWLEELRAHVGRDEAIVGHSGRVPLVAITAEIVNAAADERS